MKASVQCCALPLCNLVDDLRVCSRCQVSFYCGKDHQRRHWKTHKTDCIFNETEPANNSTSPPTCNVDWFSKAVINNNNPDSESDHQTNLVKDMLSMTDPFAKKRSLDKGDDSCVDLKHLDINADGDASTSRSEISDSTATEKIEQDTLSDQILRSHSYPLTCLTPFKEDETEGKERTAGSVKSEWQVGASEPVLPAGPSRYSPGKVGIKKQSKEWLEKFTHYLVESLNQFGICVVDRVLGNERGEMILQELKNLHQEGRFSDGQLVRTNVKDKPVQKGAIRGDKIMWTDGVNPPNENINYLISVMDTIIQMTNGHFDNVNIVTRTKAMLACYPGTGSGYVKHVDNPTEDGRCITCIYYLNKGWDSRKHGGLLRIYPQGHDRVANIEPRFDRILFFWSDRRNPHEVLPAYKTRYAITVWYFNPTERARAKAKRPCINTPTSSKPSTTT